MNSEKRKRSDPQRPLISLSDKINLKRIDKDISLSNRSICCTWKNI